MFSKHSTKKIWRNVCFLVEVHRWTRKNPCFRSLKTVHFKFSLEILTFLECGSAFTQKLEGMFKDMEVSKELGATFKQVNIFFANIDKLEIFLSPITLKSYYFSMWKAVVAQLICPKRNSAFPF